MVSTFESDGLVDFKYTYDELHTAENDATGLYFFGRRDQNKDSV